MPGVVVSTKAVKGPSGLGDVPIGQLFLVGEAERGPTDAPKLVRSMGEYVTYFGDYAAGNLWLHAKTFFEEGGGRLKVMRVAGSGATAGTLNLEDRASPTAVDTIQVDAANVGSWSDQLKVAVEDGVASDTFVLKFYLNNELLLTTRDLTDPADAVNYVNASTVNYLFTLTDLSSATSAPDDNPAVLAATALSAGGDGSAVDATAIIAGFDLILYPEGPGAIAAPGYTGATVWGALVDHGRANNRVAISAHGQSDAAATAKSNIANMYSDADAEYLATYWPWIKVEDPANQGLKVSISPESYVAGVRNRAIVEAGPWKAYAGVVSEANSILELETDVSKAVGDGLDEKRINAIRKIGNTYRIYGARSTDNDEVNWRFINYRDLVNYLVAAAEARLEDLVFATIDSRGTLFAKIKGTLTGLLDPIRLAGGLYEAYDEEGNLIDPGYSIQVDNSNNPAAELAAGRVHVDVGVRPSSIGDQIIVTITKSNLLSSIS